MTLQKQKTCPRQVLLCFCSRLESNQHHILRKDASYPLNDGSERETTTNFRNVAFIGAFSTFLRFPQLLPRSRAYDCDMYTSSRGASILAAIAFVAVLGIALTGIEAVSSANSQTAAAAGPSVGAFTSSSPTSPNVSGQVTAAKGTQSEACKRQIQAAIKSGTGESPITTQQFKKNATEQNVCTGAVLKTGATDKTKADSYRCTGELSKVGMNKTTGAGIIKSAPDPSDPPQVTEGQCLTKFCDLDAKGNFTKCSDSKVWKGTESVQAWALSGDTFKSLSLDQKDSVLKNLSAVSSNDQQQLSSLLGQNQQAAAQDTATLNSAASDCANGIQKAAASLAVGEACFVNDQIAQLAQANGAQCSQSTSGYTCDAASLKQAAANSQITQDQLKNLAASQVALTPQDGTFTGPCPAGQTQGTTGCVTSGSCPQGNCTTGPTPSPSTVPTGSQTSPNNNTSGGGSGGSNPLSSLLSGLMKGLSGGASSAPPPAPAQACSTDPNAYAQQQQQYQQALQQYNYQQQQYNYQLQYSSQSGNSVAPVPPQQPTPCSPSSQNQCSTQPQQPAASTCTGGSWQPVYSGSCVTNWQCSAGQASLSCEPQTADVGMSIAISYSCAAGTASGGGFTASGQSGTSTAIIATPPDGTNTATYSLSCVNGGQTAGAQCSIQVAAPSIVLVANPKTIHAGGTSQIGWITSGMQSCVISSPDQPNFTAQNASNTSVGGTAQTDAIATSSASFNLHCQTTAGGTRDATTTVSVQ